MSKKLFIFGAGASYGSDTSDTPVLGNKLFHKLQSVFPESWGILSNEIEKAFTEDFEKGMVYLSKKYSHLLPPLQRAMAVYFFEIKLYSTNLYLELMPRVKSNIEDISFVTFNYERLLETAINHSGMAPCCGGKPRNENEIEVCYPHGCCHFFNKSIKATGAANIIIKGPGIHTSGKVEAIMKPDEFYNRISNDPFPPIMSYFEPNKDTLSGINFINTQRQRYEQLVINAEFIAIIGLKLRESDIHIWQPIAETKADILYCSGKNAGEEYKYWSKRNRRNKDDIIINDYFSDGFEEICSRAGI